MGINDGTVDETRETAAEFQGSGKPTGFENVKNSIADNLHYIARVLCEKAANQDAQSDMAQYEKQASEWLGQSADYVRQFDYEVTEKQVREYVRQRPGRSLLIAGGVGLLIGAVLRRR
jgi:ElaB/YqjD/DUF883 family membrane-anchored ribosome-binding protein